MYQKRKFAVRKFAPLFLLAGVLCSSNVLAEDSATTIPEAISGGDASLSFRLRIEQVDQDAFAETALASTLRTRLNYKTAAYKGLVLFLEADDITYVGDDKFNSTRNGVTNYPVVADPSGTDINQANIRYSLDAVTLTAGRQRINRDNQRFVGGVGWRQNEQTYDAFDAGYNAGDLDVSYTYVTRVARVFGPDDGAPAPRLDSDSHFVNVKYGLGDAGDLSAYAYLLDFDNAASSSTRTIGIRYVAGFDIGGPKIPLVLEYADQSDYGNNPANYSASYLAIETGLAFDTFSVVVGNEILEGTPTGVFVTPLATLHKFQGWADLFLATPAGGINDLYLTGKASAGGFGFSLTYHQFEADLGSADYGTEFDFSVDRKLGPNVSLLLKAAQYDADTFATDTTKIWLMVSVNF